MRPHGVGNPFDQREAEKGLFIKNWLRQLVDDYEIVISTQMLIELRAVLGRKLQPSLSASESRLALAAFDVMATDASLVFDAHELAISHQLPWFDTMILEAAIRSHCRILYSEDFNSGQHFGDLEVRNPSQGF